MKTNILKVWLFSLLLCSVLPLHAGRIYDEFDFNRGNYLIQVGNQTFKCNL